MECWQGWRRAANTGSCVVIMRLLLSGYYGLGNTGDEAILDALVTGLRTRVPDLELHVLSADPLATAAQYSVEAVSRWSLWQQLREIRAANLFIQGGGGLFQDTTSKLSAIYYLNQLVIARTVNTQYMICAQGIGPIQSSYLRGCLVRNFSRACIVTVRDPESAEDLQKWGLHHPQPIVTADPVLLLEPAPAEVVDELLASLKLTRNNYIAVALRTWPGAESAYEAIVKWLSGLDRPVLLLPFQYEADVEIAREIQNRLATGAARVAPRQYGPRQVMGIIKAADEVLAMRLHALIMACATGTTAAGLSYDPKVNAFCHRSGQPVMGLRLFEQGAAEDLMTAARNAGDRVQQRRQDLMQQAAKTLDLVARLCNGIAEE